MTNAATTTKTLPVDIGGSTVPGYVWAALSDIKLGGRNTKTGEKLSVCRWKMQGLRLPARFYAEISADPGLKKQIDELFVGCYESGQDDHRTKDMKVCGIALVAH